MAWQVKTRSGTTAEHATFAGADTEITYDTTKNTLVAHDGTKLGGFPLAREDMSNSTPFTGSTNAVAGTKGSVPAPNAGDQNKVLYGDGTWRNLPQLQVVNQTSTNHVLVLADANRYLRMTATAPKTLVVPRSQNVDFPIGTTISGISVGGQLTIGTEVAVIVNTPETLVLRDKSFVSFVLTKVGTNEWDLAGDFET